MSSPLSSNTFRIALLSLSCLALLSACGEPDKKEDEPLVIIIDDPDMAKTNNTMTVPSNWVLADNLPKKCTASGAPWDGAKQVFRNRTEGSVFETLSVDAVRLSTVDFDGDGYPDLVARRGGVNEDEWKADGKRGMWLMKNMGDGTFEDVTQASGIVARRDNKPELGRPAEVVAWGDVDNDGDLDVFTAFSNQPPLSNTAAEIMLNNGDGTFSFGPLGETDIRRPNEALTVGGLAMTDVNRDGFLDIWVGHGGPEQDHLYLGNGKGNFKRQTTEAGMITKEWQNIDDLNNARAHTNAWGVNACDLNADGVPELLASSYGRSPNHLWLGALMGNDVAYTNHSIASGYAFDDNQDWSDNISARCYCKLNPGGPDCAGVPMPTIRCESADDVFRWTHSNDREPFRLGGNSGTTVCADLNNDGLLDLMTTEIVHSDVGQSSDRSELLYNTGNATFERPGRDKTGIGQVRTGLGWDDGDITGAAFDFDNDGRMDVYIGSTTYNNTRGYLYHQQPDGTFKEVLTLLGIDHKSSHGIAVADYDRDGDLDVIVGHARGRCSTGNHCYDDPHVRYFENVLGATQNNWFQIKLVGKDGANVSAIGAQVTVETDALKLVQEVGGGHGHYGIQHELPLHFGLGSACEAKVTIKWPDKSSTTQTVNLSSGYRYRIVQGAAPQVAKADL